MKISTKDLEQCPVNTTMNVIRGKWKVLIIHLINNDINRFSKISMMLRPISKQMLASQLAELEKDGILERVLFSEAPPRVEYYLTPRGKALVPILTALKEWCDEHVFAEVEATANFNPIDQ